MLGWLFINTCTLSHVLPLIYENVIIFINNTASFSGAKYKADLVEWEWDCHPKDNHMC